MEKYFKILRNCPLFDGIDDKDIIPLLSCLAPKTERFEKKYTVIAEGSPAKYIFIVLSGTVQILKIDYFGNRNILSEVSPCELFAESFACAQETAMPISAVANTDSEIMMIDGNRIMHTCASNCNFHRQLIFNLMKILAVKNIMFHQKIEITQKRTTREKLLAYLDFFEKKSGKTSFYIPFDRQELADYLEVDRSGLSAEISKLRKEGIIECRKNHFKLL